MDIRFDLRWRCGGDIGEIDPQLFRLLQFIQEGGSLRAAATECAISYRHAWGLLQKWEHSFGHPLARLERGKGAVLTALGLKLLWGEKRVRARLEPQFDSLASELSAALNDVITVGDQPALRIFASHGLAIALLRDLVRASQNLRLDLQFQGSLESLRLFKSGRCDVAGFHLPEGVLGTRLAPRFRRFLNPHTDALIHVVRRRQGLMTAPSNPKGIHALSDLAQSSVRFVNRQIGSGTRAALDLLLEEAQVDPDRIQGYSNEEFTHMAVAAMVASGGADAGFGIEAAARQFGLQFVPFSWENYWFALRREMLNNPVVSNFLAVLRGPEFEAQVAALPGYEARRAGSIVPVDAAGVASEFAG
ncbi:MAG: substrate-binding domain-containing protein [Pseudomonadota bacterium]